MKNSYILLSSCTVVSVSSLAFPADIYVDRDGSINGDGSPTNHYKTLVAGIAAAGPAGGDVIFVADGIYTPGTSPHSSFVLKKVHIIGGYAGLSATNGWNASNPDQYETVLSGLIDPMTGAKAYTVVKALLPDMNPQNTSLSNVTIQDGYNNNNGHGGGIRVTDGANPRFHRCKIRENVATYAGAGVYVKESAPVFTRCEIRENQIPQYTTDQVTFGAGLAATDGAHPQLINCVVRENTLVYGWGGGGIAVRDRYSQLTLVNCLIISNLITFPEIINPERSTGAGIFLFEDEVDLIPGPTANIVNTTISANSSWHGAGLSMYRTDGSVTYLRNSIIWGNVGSATSGSQVLMRQSSMTGEFSNVPRYHQSLFYAIQSSVSWSGNDPQADPLFTNGYQLLSCASPCVNTGNPNTSVIPADLYDLDGDSSFSEPTPDLLLADRARRTPDMGAYELQSDHCDVDFTGADCDNVPDGAINVSDLLCVINQWGCTGTCSADVGPLPCGGDGVVNVSDLLAVITAWGGCNGMSGGFPQTISECFNVYCAGLSGEEWQKCINSCVEAVCSENPEECE